MQTSDSTRPVLARRRGFTLVETALAVAILSVTLVPLLALMPSGMRNFRSAMDRSICAQIAQAVIVDAQQTDFDLLIDRATLDSLQPAIGFTFRGPAVATPELRYFDERGTEVRPAEAGALSNAERLRVVYQVNTRIRPEATVPTTDSLQTLAGEGVARGFHMAAVTVEVAAAPASISVPLTPESATDGRANLFAPPAGVPVYTYTALVGRGL